MITRPHVGSGAREQQREMLAAAAQIESLTLPSTGQRDRGTAPVASSVRRDEVRDARDQA